MELHRPVELPVEIHQHFHKSGEILIIFNITDWPVFNAFLDNGIKCFLIDWAVVEAVEAVVRKVATMLGKEGEALFHGFLQGSKVGDFNACCFAKGL